MYFSALKTNESETETETGDGEGERVETDRGGWVPFKHLRGTSLSMIA